MNLYQYIQKRKAKKHGVKINDLSNISLNASIIMEESTSLGSAHVRATAGDPFDIKIGAYSYIRSGEIMWLGSIGRFCSIGQNVSIGEDPRNHPINWASTSHSLCVDHTSTPARTNIGNDVWIGHNATIMSGLNIGHGAIIAKNAVVTKDVEPYQIVGGNPAKVLKNRFDSEVIALLVASEWWDKDIEELKSLDYRNVTMFANEAKKINKVASYKKIFIKNRQISI